MKKAESVSTEYLALIEKFPLRPLRSERELKRAVKVVDGLIGRKRSKDEEDYLHVLGGLIEGYEDVHHPIEESAPQDMLAHLIEASGKSARKVALEAKIQPSTMSELLSGVREINTTHIRKLAPYFGVAPGVFIAPLEDLSNSADIRRPLSESKGTISPEELGAKLKFKTKKSVEAGKARSVRGGAAKRKQSRKRAS